MDLLTTPTERAPSSSPPRHRIVITWLRLGLAMAILAVGAVRVVVAAARAYPHNELDPAPLFYLAGILGLGLRLFWARYLVICFVASITAIGVVWGSQPGATAAVGLLLIASLSGRTMRALFEERAARMNRWAGQLDRRVGRLRLLFVAQSLGMGLLWAIGSRLSPSAVPLVVAAGVVLVGLVFQRTWAALAVAPVILLEGALAVKSFSATIPYSDLPSWVFGSILLLAVGVSLVVIAPLLWAIGQKLRSAG